MTSKFWRDIDDQKKDFFKMLGSINDYDNSSKNQKHLSIDCNKLDLFYDICSNDQVLSHLFSKTVFPLLAMINKELYNKHRLFLRKEWNEALQSMNAISIRNLLYSGYIPNKVNEDFYCIDKSGNTFESIIELIINDSTKVNCVNKFKIADRLISHGAKVKHVPNRKIEDVISYQDPVRFYLYVRNYPESASKILIEIVRNPSLLGDSNAKLDILLSTRELDFSIKDKNGDTLLHTIISLIKEEIDSKLIKIFRRCVSEAVRQGFNFETSGKRKFTVLHLAAKSKTDYLVYIILENLKNNITKQLLDQQCSKGGTAFYYAVHYRNLKSSKALFNAGADPEIGKLTALKEIDKIIRGAKSQAQIGMYCYDDTMKFVNLKERFQSK